VEDLKKLNKNKKLVKKLAKGYHAFLASEAVIKQIPRLLGPGLNKAGKFPSPIAGGKTVEGALGAARPGMGGRVGACRAGCGTGNPPQGHGQRGSPFFARSSASSSTPPPSSHPNPPPPHPTPSHPTPPLPPKTW
jgi:hypothetical protein